MRIKRVTVEGFKKNFCLMVGFFKHTREKKKKGLKPSPQPLAPPSAPFPMEGAGSQGYDMETESQYSQSLKPLQQKRNKTGTNA